MKKCSGCEREIDKYAIACEYCGRLDKEHDHNKPADSSGQSAKKGQKRGNMDKN